MRALLLLAILALAGCLEGEPMRTSPAAPPHAEATDAGFRLAGDAAGETFRFVATNEGGDAMALSDPCGDGNPRIAVLDANGTRLQLRPPQARCMAVASFQPFAAGGALSANLTWNGTAYQGERAYAAPPGDYAVVGTFEGRRGASPVELSARLPATIRG